MPAGADLAQDAVLVLVLALAAALLLVARRRARRPAPPPPVAVEEDPPARRRWVAVVANPTKVDDAAARQAWVGEAGARYGLGDPVWLETTVEDPGLGQADTAVENGAAAVLAYGGDGTVRSVASRLVGTGIPLGLLPAGTGNLLARNLGVPVNDLDSALHTALAGTDRKLDVGRVTVDVSGEDVPPRRDVFLVMTGLGFDAEVMASVEPRLKKRVGWLAYVVAGARLLRGRQTKVVITMDGEPPVHRRVRSVVVGNCGELTAGVRLLPDARPDDGWLDVVTVAPRNVIGWAAVIAAIISGSRRGHPLVERFRCRQVDIRAERPLQVQIDGDAAGLARALSAGLDPLGLVVRVPGDAARAG